MDLKPEYFGFAAASKYLVGYGLPDGQGLYRNLAYVGSPEKAGRSTPRTRSGRKSGKKAKR